MEGLNRRAASPQCFDLVQPEGEKKRRFVPGY